MPKNNSLTENMTPKKAIILLSIMSLIYSAIGIYGFTTNDAYFLWFGTTTTVIGVIIIATILKISHNSSTLDLNQ